MNEKLRECPFCGSDKLDYESYGDSFTVVCLDCDSEGGMGDLVKACELWNTRSINTPKHETVEELREAYETISVSWIFASSIDSQPKRFCFYCNKLWEDHSSDCIVLKADKWLDHHGKPEVEG